MLSFAAIRIAPLVMLLILYNGSCSCKATDAQLCSRWCGVHNISHPFRLKDSPDKCGDHRYTLSCEDNQLMLYLESEKYIVQSINYNNYTIRVVDVNLGQLHYPSLPLYSLTLNNFRYYYYELYRDTDLSWNRLMKSMLYVSCPNGVESSGVYVDDSATCMNSSHVLGNSFYVYDGNKSLWDLGLPDSCRIEFIYRTSWPGEMGNGNVSCGDMYEMLLYGFELSWVNSLCEDDGYVLELYDNHRPHCVYSGTYNFVDFVIFILETILYWVYAAMGYHNLRLVLSEKIVGLIVDFIILLCVAKFFLGAPCIIVLFIYKWRRRHLSMYDTIEDFLRSDNNITPIRYSYRDIKSITEGFKTKLGNGGYGSVFKGKLRSGRFVAVKVLDKAKANGQEFINEVATIGRIHHVNVVQLIGFCVDGSKRALIYEFMPNGSLEKYIFSHEESSSLNCEKLYAISVGVARGIEYLHNGCNMKILHFDIKPHNILLDENFNPKVSDFGLARLSPTDNSIVSLTAARGTIGYMAPELFYRNVGTISYKADVYSFGMLLMEMASRRKNLNALAEESSQIYFPFWVYDRLQNGSEITIENDTDEEMKLAKKMMIVALWCIQTRPGDRPSMNKVLEMLEQDEELQMPDKPYLYPQDLPEEDVSDHSSSGPSSDISISDSKE